MNDRQHQELINELKAESKQFKEIINRLDILSYMIFGFIILFIFYAAIK